MYVWARNTILGDLNGLCFGGREFGAGRTGGKFKKLPVSQERIDKWGESLRVSVRFKVPLHTVERLIHRRLVITRMTYSTKTD